MLISLPPHRNPMCSVFPTVTSCNIPNVGAGGGEQMHNGLCVLTQNIINEKIYLVLWWWYAFLAPLTVLFIGYRSGMTIRVEPARTSSYFTG